jgi:hypothetical protein
MTTHGSHLSMPRWESSKRVPTLIENCFRGALFLALPEVARRQEDTGTYSGGAAPRHSGGLDVGLVNIVPVDPPAEFLALIQQISGSRVIGWS